MFERWKAFGNDAASRTLVLELAVAMVATKNGNTAHDVVSNVFECTRLVCTGKPNEEINFYFDDQVIILLCGIDGWGVRNLHMQIS